VLRTLELRTVYLPLKHTQREQSYLLLFSVCTHTIPGSVIPNSCFIA